MKETAGQTYFRLPPPFWSPVRRRRKRGFFWRLCNQENLSRLAASRTSYMNWKRKFDSTFRPHHSPCFVKLPLLDVSAFEKAGDFFCSRKWLHDRMRKRRQRVHGEQEKKRNKNFMMTNYIESIRQRKKYILYRLNRTNKGDEATYI